MKYAEVIQSLANSLITRFDLVYHSAEIITADNDRFPAVAVNKDWVNLSPTDIKEAIYIRRNGDDEVIEDLKIGSCIKSYKMRSQLRVVFFKDNSDNHSKIIYNLMQSVLIGGTKLNKIIRDKYRLLKDESSGSYTFGPKAAYFAIDVSILWQLVPDNCDDDFCVDIDNPLKRESCLAAVQES